MSEARKLRPSEVRHLAFEGGGGKGAAYLGALWALQDPDIGILGWTKDSRGRTRLKPNRLEGIAGSSAGALTAMLLASGYDTASIGRLIGKLGRAGSSNAQSSTLYDDPNGNALAVRQGPVRPGEPRDPCAVSHASPTDSVVARILDNYLGLSGPALPRELAEALGAELLNSAPTSLFLERPAQYAASVVLGKGAMSGCALRNTLDALLAAQSTDARGRPIANLTFRNHRDLHGVTLVVTGTDVETSTSRYFSADETPDLRVADAVRISMGFPFVFKPVVIRDGELRGTWIDGGALNNTPIHAFDDRAELRRSVLGLRLGVSSRRPIESFLDYVDAVVTTLLSAAETLHVRTPQEEAQTISLPVGKLSMLNFEPSPAQVRVVAEEVGRVVMNYFGLNRPPAPLES